MVNTRTLNRSFNGGEITPEMFGRVDDSKYQSGLAQCRNFIPLPHGPVQNRPGTAFVREVKTSAKRTRIIPFSYSTTQTMVIEIGEGYFRFHTQGATVLDGGVPYEVVNPYSETDLFDLHYVQSADVLTLVHPNHPPAELRRLGATNWTYTAIQFGTTLAAPGIASVTATVPSSPTNLRDYYYKVTALNDASEESMPSSAGVTNTPNNLTLTGAKNTIAIVSSPGATRYRVYKQDNGLFGYIGETDGLTFDDENITADVSYTPPNLGNPFDGVGNYPGAVSYFEQRRCFGGTINSPQTLWMTKSGTERNLNYSIPTRDDDGISFRIAAREANTIRHIVPLTSLVLLTSAAEWRVTSVNSDALTPSSVQLRPQSYIGSNNAQPVIVNNNLLFAAARGGHMRELAYNWQASGYITGDLSLRAPHLFDGMDILDIAYAKAPVPLVWCVSSSGKLLGLTYVPEQQIGAWHHHDTDGVFESVCVVAEGNEDVLYLVVRRVIGGVPKRYIERLATRMFETPATAFFVDCGASYDGVPTSVIASGLSHLEGKTVNILTDGAVHPSRVVTGGGVTLDYEASVIQVGLPIEADLQTLPIAIEIPGWGQGRPKNVNKVWLRLYESGAPFVGPGPNSLTEGKVRTTENYGSPPNLKTGELEVLIGPTWDDGGQVFVRHKNPLPLTILSTTFEISIGG